jgi:hypothetical protein
MLKSLSKQNENKKHFKIGFLHYYCGKELKFIEEKRPQIPLLNDLS